MNTKVPPITMADEMHSSKLKVIRRVDLLASFDNVAAKQETAVGN